MRGRCKPGLELEFRVGSCKGWVWVLVVVLVYTQGLGWELGM
jgi:hypothetical protein